HEPESEVLRAHVARARRGLASSAIARVELTRAVRLRNPAGGKSLHELFDDLTFVAVDETLLMAAAKFADAHLRTIDAIHLASALEIGATEMLVYDRRLAEAAEAVGITPVGPR